MFVSLEGIDGCGKSTLAPKVAAILGTKGAVFSPKKPLAEQPSSVAVRMADLRATLWPGGAIPDGGLLPAEYWLFLQAAWYTLSSSFVISPLMKGDQVVLVDGWYYKSLAKAALDGVSQELLGAAMTEVVGPGLGGGSRCGRQGGVRPTGRVRPARDGGYHDYRALGVDSYVDHQTRVMEEIAAAVPRDVILRVRLDADEDPDTSAARVAAAIRVHLPWAHPEPLLPKGGR